MLKIVFTLYIFFFRFCANTNFPDAFLTWFFLLLIIFFSKKFILTIIFPLHIISLIFYPYTLFICIFTLKLNEFSLFSQQRLLFTISFSLYRSVHSAHLLSTYILFKCIETVIVFSTNVHADNYLFSIYHSLALSSVNSFQMHFKFEMEQLSFIVFQKTQFILPCASYCGSYIINTKLNTL